MKVLKACLICLSLLFVFLTSSCSKDEVVKDQIQSELPSIQAAETVSAMVML